MSENVEICSRCNIETDDYFCLFEPACHYLCHDCFNLMYPPFIPVLKVEDVKSDEHIENIGRLL